MTIRYAVLLLALFVAAVLCFQPISTAPAQLLPSLEFAQQLFPQKTVLLSAETGGLVTSMPFGPQDFVKTDDLLVQLDSDLVDIEIERYETQIEMDTGIRKAEILLKFRRESLDIAEDLYSIILDNITEDPNSVMRAGSWKELQEAKQLFEDSELEEIRALLALKDLQLSVRRFQKNKEQLDIRAPWDGVIVKFDSIKEVPSLEGTKQVEVGEMVQTGQPVIALMKIDTLKIPYRLPLLQLPQVSLNQRARVTVEGFGNEPIEGRVTFIAPRVTFGDTVNIEVEFANPLILDAQALPGVYRYRYRPGMRVAVQLDI